LEDAESLDGHGRNFDDIALGDDGVSILNGALDDAASRTKADECQEASGASDASGWHN
jgi:hypothetical protein